MTTVYTTLNNGKKMPAIGLGTWKAEPGAVRQAVYEAIKIGYRHIDCASIYGNESDVGDGIKTAIDNGVCLREDLFITSKLWVDSKLPDEVIPALKESLKKLKLEYLDLYLIHWPVTIKKSPEGVVEFINEAEVPNSKTWEQMEKAVTMGLVQSIGVSNFSHLQLDKLWQDCTIPPAVNQIERHPYLQRTKLLEYCESKNIHVTAFSPLGSMDRPESMKHSNEPVLLEEPRVMMIAKKHRCSPAQVLLRWGLQTGTSVIAKSTNQERLKSNLECVRVRLDADDLSKLAELDHGIRFVDGSMWCEPSDSPWTMEALWAGA